jgi:hypothetical protein
LVKIGGAKNLGILLSILRNVIEKSFINWQVLSLVKINKRISGTVCIFKRKILEAVIDLKDLETFHQTSEYK